MADWLRAELVLKPVIRRFTRIFERDDRAVEPVRLEPGMPEPAQPGDGYQTELVIGLPRRLPGQQAIGDAPAFCVAETSHDKTRLVGLQSRNQHLPQLA